MLRGKIFLVDTPLREVPVKVVLIKGPVVTSRVIAGPNYARKPCSAYSQAQQTLGDLPILYSCERIEARVT